MTPTLFSPVLALSSSVVRGQQHDACAQMRQVSGIWRAVKDGHEGAAALFRRHYTYNAKRAQISIFWQRNRNYGLFVGPGEKLVLLTQDERALFVWRKFISMDRQDGVSCSVFRNEGPHLSSDLIRAADDLAWRRWPGARLYTYVDPRRTRHKRDPGRCFLKAGWTYCGWSKAGLRILECRPQGANAEKAQDAFGLPGERQNKQRVNR